MNRPSRGSIWQKVDALGLACEKCGLEFRMPARAGPTTAGSATIDPLTAYVFAIVMMLLNGGILGMLHGELPEPLRPAGDGWRVATVLIASAVILFIVQEFYPYFDWIRIIGNTLMTLGVSVYARALRRFYGLVDARLQWLPAVATLAGVWWFVAIQPSMVGRIGISTLFWLVALLDGAGVLLRQREDRSISRRAMIGVFVVVIAFALGRVVWFLATPDPGDSVFDASQPLNALSPLVLSILPIIGTTVFLMMCSERLRMDLERAASIDYLTGLPNRRTLAIEGQRRMQVARDEGRELALALVDLDHFKHVNDGYGHAAGDQVLVEVAKLLRKSAHTGDLIVRLGGEEFVFVLPGSDCADALERMERLRALVAERSFRLADQEVPITISIGVSCLHGNADFGELLRRADAALYQAKEDGRNRVWVDAQATSGTDDQSNSASLSSAAST